jgi:hypothetical protein
MEKLLIRASKAYCIVTEPKLKADKEAGNLSETAKTYLNELWLEENYSYREPLFTDEIMKGLTCEQDCLSLVQKVLGGKLRIKNTEHFSNEFIKGTPDVILDNCIEDVKTSFNVKTFHNAELLPAYYWQAQCYMALCGKSKYRLIYGLVNTPSEIVTDLKKRIYYKFDCNEENTDYQKASKQIEHNHNFDTIPAEKRIKVFEFEFEPEKIKFLYSKITKAREFYANIKF